MTTDKRHLMQNFTVVAQHVKHYSDSNALKTAFSHFMTPTHHTNNTISTVHALKLWLSRD